MIRVAVPLPTRPIPILPILRERSDLSPDLPRMADGLRPAPTLSTRTPRSESVPTPASATGRGPGLIVHLPIQASQYLSHQPDSRLPGKKRAHNKSCHPVGPARNDDRLLAQCSECLRSNLLRRQRLRGASFAFRQIRQVVRCGDGAEDWHAEALLGLCLHMLIGGRKARRPK